MTLFDQFGPAQAGNGQAPPNQPAVGAPGFNFQSWGHTPPNMAGGLQQFLRGNAPPNPGMPQVNNPMLGTPQTGMFGAPAGGLPVAGGPQPGMFGASAQPGQLLGSPQMSTGFMPPPQGATTMQGTMAGSTSGAPPNVAGMGGGGMMPGTVGNTNLAGGMTPYLGMMRPR